jgi:hypothetical protein
MHIIDPAMSGLIFPNLETNGLTMGDIAKNINVKGRRTSEAFTEFPPNLTVMELLPYIAGITRAGRIVLFTTSLPSINGEGDLLSNIIKAIN